MEIDLRKPVTCGRIINFNSKSIWVPIKHEKLPKIYFHCGRIVHGNGGCDAGLSNGKQSTSDRQFGMLLRVDNRMDRKGMGDLAAREGSSTSSLKYEAKCDRER